MCLHCFALTCKLKWDFEKNSSFLQRLPSGNRSCSTQNLISVCTLKQTSGDMSCGFTNIKSNWNMSRSDWKCSPVHEIGKSVEVNIFYVNNRRGALGEWVTQRARAFVLRVKFFSNLITGCIKNVCILDQSPRHLTCVFRSVKFDHCVPRMCCAQTPGAPLTDMV